ncbi:MAG: hypothetical protein ACO2ZM_07535 [Francisellaceae bacterium]
MKQRRFHNSNITVSQVSLGSMRLHEKLTIEEAEKLVNNAWHLGIDTFHSSFEYESHGFFCEVLRRLKHKDKSFQPKHIVKLAVPHFEEMAFSKARFRQLIEQQLQALNTGRIEVVQWLLRHKLNTDEYRLPMLQDCTAELSEVVGELKREGKIGIFTGFAYSQGFAREFIDMSVCEGLTDYLNLQELDRISLFELMEDKKQNFLAIRPLNAGGILGLHEDKKNRVMEALGTNNIIEAASLFPLLHPVVKTEIISVGSLEHLQEIVRVTSNTSANKSRFANTVEVLHGQQLVS